MKARRRFQHFEAANPTIWLPAHSDAIEFRCGAPRWVGKWPSKAWESEECRISRVQWLGAATSRKEQQSIGGSSCIVVIYYGPAY